MDKDKPTQKQISNRYDGAADYPGRPHYFRRLRVWLFVSVAVAATLGALAYSYLGKQNAYSPGPISQNHSSFASDCRVCHRDSDGVFSKLGQLAPDSPDPGKGLASSSLARMDAACLQCHATASLHLPQAASIGLRAVSGELTVVHASACASCHREHVGHDRMALPTQQTCVACHNDADKLKLARESGKIAHTAVAAAGENRNLGDGLVRFLTPPREPGALKAFASYADGHPPFAYEKPDVRDPAPLKFNHERHLRADIPKVNNHRLDCADCHQAGADGSFNQPVKYAKHCVQCHTLQFQPSLPKMLVPHGDPEKVRYFLAGREVAFDLALRAEGISDPAGLKQRVQIEVQALSRRGLNNLNDLEQRVFFDGDPPDRKDSRLGRAGNPKFLTECAKCHEVSPGTASHAPKVERPTMAERWVQHGPFTHLPHQHMKCTDCHGAALKSTATKDILLPPQTLCAECHRPPTAASEATAAAPRGDVHVLAAAQRASGGIKWDCTDCHAFHAPLDAQAILGPPPKPPGNAVAK
jgi:hypothetical protein